jgi:hypothetical protein
MRLRFYKYVTTAPNERQSFEEMQTEDDKQIKEYQKMMFKASMKLCQL